MWYWHDGMGWLAWLVMVLTMLLFWGAIIGLAIWGISKLTGGRGSGPSTGGRRDPLDIAKERYAKGELSREEFEQIKEDLS